MKRCLQYLALEIHLFFRTIGRIKEIWFMACITLNETPYQIGVFGSGTVDPERYQMAYDVGAAVAKKGHVLISGGLSGAMEASSRGAAEAGGLVIGDGFCDNYAFDCQKKSAGSISARVRRASCSCCGKRERGRGYCG